MHADDRIRLSDWLPPQELRQLPAWQAFLGCYPGHTVSPVEGRGFLLWLRCMDFFNLFLIFMIIRAGIQILADQPRLYWNVNCTPHSASDS